MLLSTHHSSTWGSELAAWAVTAGACGSCGGSDSLSPGEHSTTVPSAGEGEQVSVQARWAGNGGRQVGRQVRQAVRQASTRSHASRS